MTTLAGEAAIRIVPTMRGFKTEADRQLRTMKFEPVSVRLAPETARASAEMDAWRKRQELNAINIRVRANTNEFARDIQTVEHIFKRSALQRAMRLNIKVVGLDALPALAYAAGSAASGIDALAKSVFALPGLLGGALASVGALAVGMHGVAAAFKAYSTDSTKSAQSARDIASANRDVERSYRDYKSAVRDTVREIQDLNAENRRSSLNVADAILSVQEAADKLRKGGQTSIRERQRDQLDYLRSIDHLQEVQTKANRVAEDTQEANAKGVTGADKVADALKRVADATDKLNKKNTGADTFATELAKLSTEAQKGVNAALSFKGAWDKLTASVQNNLWAGLDRTITDLGQRALPGLEVGLSRVASGLNANFKTVAESLGNKGNQGLLQRVFGNTDGGLQNLSRAMNPLIEGFLRLTKESSDFLPRLGLAAEKVFTRFDNWTDKISKDGSLDTWIDSGLKALNSLGHAATNIASIVSSVSKAFDTASGHQGGFIKTLETASEKLATFLKSGKGQNSLVGYFQQAKTLIENITGAVQKMRPFLSDMVDTAREWSQGLFAVVGGLLSAAGWIERNTGLLKYLLMGYLTFKTVAPIVDGVTAAWRNYAKVITAMNASNAFRNIPGVGWTAGQVAKAKGQIGAITTAQSAMTGAVAAAGQHYVTMGRNIDSVAGKVRNLASLQASAANLAAGVTARADERARREAAGVGVTGGPTAASVAAQKAATERARADATKASAQAFATGFTGNRGDPDQRAGWRQWQREMGAQPLGTFVGPGAARSGSLAHAADSPYAARQVAAQRARVVERALSQQAAGFFPTTSRAMQGPALPPNFRGPKRWETFGNYGGFGRGTSGRDLFSGHAAMQAAEREAQKAAVAQQSRAALNGFVGGTPSVSRAVQGPQLDPAVYRNWGNAAATAGAQVAVAGEQAKSAAVPTERIGKVATGSTNPLVQVAQAGQKAAAGAQAVGSAAANAAPKVSSVGGAAATAATQVGSTGAGLLGSLKGLAGAMLPGLALMAGLALVMGAVQKLGEAHRNAARDAKAQDDALKNLAGTLDSVTGAFTNESLDSTLKQWQQPTAIPGLDPNFKPFDAAQRLGLDPAAQARLTAPNQTANFEAEQSKNVDQLVKDFESTDLWKGAQTKFKAYGLTSRDVVLAQIGDDAAQKKFQDAIDHPKSVTVPGGRAAATLNLPDLGKIINAMPNADRVGLAQVLQQGHDANAAQGNSNLAASQSRTGERTLAAGDAQELMKFSPNLGSLTTDLSGSGVVQLNQNPDKATRDRWSEQFGIEVSETPDATGVWTAKIPPGLTDAWLAKVPGHKDGGLVGGIGGPRDDLNLVKVSPGEHIAQAAAVKFYGTKLFDDLNNMRIPRHAGGAWGMGFMPPLTPPVMPTPPPVPDIFTPPTASAPTSGTGPLPTWGSSPIQSALGGQQNPITSTPATTPATTAPAATQPSWGTDPTMAAPTAPASVPEAPLAQYTPPAPSLAGFPALNGYGMPQLAGGIPLPNRGGEDGLQVDTIRAKRAIETIFPQITNIGGVRPDALKWHPDGLALDLMIPGQGGNNDPTTPEGLAFGNQVYAWMAAHADELGIDMSASLWQQKDHYNHIHLATKGGGYPTGSEQYSLPMDAAQFLGGNLPGGVTPGMMTQSGDWVENLKQNWSNFLDPDRLKNSLVKKFTDPWQPKNAMDFLGGLGKNVGSSLLGIGTNFLSGITGIDFQSIVGPSTSMVNGLLGGLGDSSTDDPAGAAAVGDLMSQYQAGAGWNPGGGTSGSGVSGGPFDLTGTNTSGGDWFNMLGGKGKKGGSAYRAMVRQVLKAVGPRYGITNLKAWEDAIVKQIDTESGGDPYSLNDHDSNGQGGTQTVKGLLNFLPSTFDAHNIFKGQINDPASQIGAAIDYVMSKYGMDADGGPKQIGRGSGFANGGFPGKNLAWLSKGEFRTNPKATKFYGAGLFNALNSMSLPKSSVGKFADGGWPLMQPPQPTPGQAVGPLPLPAPAAPAPTAPGIGNSVGAAQLTGGAPGPGATAPAPDPGVLPQATDALANIGGLGNAIGAGVQAGQAGAQPGASDPNQPDARATFGAAPTSSDHNITAVSAGIQGAASAIGSAIGTAAQMGLATTGAGAAGGGMASSLIGAGAQIGGQVASGAVNVLSSLLVGTATNGSTSNPSGTPLLPARAPLQSGVPQIVPQQINQQTYHISSMDELRRTEERVRAQQTMPWIKASG